MILVSIDWKPETPEEDRFFSITSYGSEQTIFINTEFLPTKQNNYTKNNLDVKMFSESELRSKEQEGYIWMTYDQCQANMDKVKNILSDYDWQICALKDGKVCGPGYNYDSQRWDKGE